MKKVIKKMVAALLLIAIGIVICGCYFKYEQSKSEKVVEKTGIVEVKSIVTRNEVEGKLKAVEQAVFYSDEWTVHRDEEWVKHISDNVPLVGGARIPFTKSTVSLVCPGVTKVGYDMDDIAFAIDDDSQKITIDLPEVKVLANYVKCEEIMGEEHESFFNQIKGEMYWKLISEVEQEGLKQAEADGIYELAEANAKVVIRDTLSEFNYQVVFQ